MREKEMKKEDEEEHQTHDMQKSRRHDQLHITSYHMHTCIHDREHEHDKHEPTQPCPYLELFKSTISSAGCETKQLGRTRLTHSESMMVRYSEKNSEFSPATLAPGPEAKGRRQRCDPIGVAINVARLVVELVEVCLLGVRDC